MCVYRAGSQAAKPYGPATLFFLYLQSIGGQEASGQCISVIVRLRIIGLAPLMNLPWTYAGLPAITLPAGRADNDLPLGLQCVAGYMQDEQLLHWATRLAAALKEKAT